MTIAGEEIDARRAHVRGLLDWATVGGSFDEMHPHYQAVTEGRDVGQMRKHYSSCGDLAHFLLFALGCRQPWINRSEHLGWKFGTASNGQSNNVSLLAGTTNPPSLAAPDSVRQKYSWGSTVDTGDILLVWNDGYDAHVMVVHSFEDGRLIVAEYGQPGGHVTSKKIEARQGAFYIGRRRLQRWLPLHLVLLDAAERGLLEPVSFPAGYVSKTDPAPPPGEDE